MWVVLRDIGLGLLTAVMMAGGAAAQSADDLAGARIAQLLAHESAALRGLTKETYSKLTTPVVTAAAASEDGAKAFNISASMLDQLPTAAGGEHWQCLTEAMYFEARGETVKGQTAVAEVILNRVKHSNYPNDICGVINQGTGRKFACQFTYTCDGLAETIGNDKVYNRLGKIARLAIDGKVPELTNGATHYHTKSVRPHWSTVYPRTATIGYHHFYKRSYRTARN